MSVGAALCRLYAARLRFMKIGVLAVQGDFQAHADMLARLGVEPVLVKKAPEIREVAGLILPGGESTTFLKFLDKEGLSAGIREAAADGKALFGTCAGAILLARRVENPAQRSLGLLDITVLRNAYGRQVESFIARGELRPSEPPLEMVFIRAPQIRVAGPEVEVLARCPRSRSNTPVFVRQGRVMATTFHPELTDDTRVHRYFLELASGKEQHLLP